MVMRRRNSSSFKRDNAFAEKMQPIAADFYRKFWPDCKIIPLDNDRKNALKRALDIGGADKMIIHPNGVVSFLGLRFRRWDCRYDDFTLRYDRSYSEYKTECEKILIALEENGMLASYYGYGHANEREDGFIRFRIVNFRKFVEKWEKGEFPYSGIKDNDDGTTFAYWPFSEFSKDLILYEYDDSKISEDMEEDKPSNALERWV